MKNLNHLVMALVSVLGLGSAPCFAKEAVPLSKSAIMKLVRGQQISLKSGPRLKSEDLIPIRHGQFKADIFKTTVTKGPDGSYSSTRSFFCSVQGLAPVYDIRNIPDADQEYEFYSDMCDGLVNGQLTHVGVAAVWLISRHKIFQSEPEFDFKFPTVYLVGGTDTMIFRLARGGDLSRDLNVHSMITNIDTSGLEICHETNDGTGDTICDSALGDFMDAVVEVLD